MIGDTILHYKILEKLGEGGMGEVYKAQDTKLDRFVALKFLPSQLTASDDDKARFIQEAKAASAMNHPNVCTIHSIEEYEKQLFIVMEFVEGKTLKDKKDSLSEKQVLEIGIQVAEGLSAAHEKGIVHRDIKPENIMVRKDGIAQIMDFGLAKLYSSGNVSRLTKAGTTMGTMGYMSPEQVQGLEVDHRTDIFSLGVVLYEMLGGESPFKGMHETAVMYEIVNVEAPPLSTLKNNIDPFLDGIILECLEKDKDDRYQSAKELAKNLRKIKRVSTGDRSSKIFNVNSGIISTKSVANRRTESSGTIAVEILNRKIDLSGLFTSRIIPWTLAVVSIIAVVFLWITLNSTDTGESVTKFTLTPAQGSLLDISGYGTLAISHDGAQIVFASNGRLYLRKLDQFDPVAIPGSENGSSPFFSPNDKWIGFFQNKKLSKVSLNGGSPISLADVSQNRGGTWNSKGTIVYSPSTTTGLYMISENGGEPKVITKLDSAKNERTHRWPSFLPDGQHVIFTVGLLSSPTYYEDASIDIVDIDTGERKTIIKGASSAKYLSPGYIAYSRSGVLYAAAFDLSSLEIKGPGIPVLHDVSSGISSGVSNYYFSDNGTLIYVKGSSEYTNRNIVKVDMEGKLTIVDSTQHVFIEPGISPDDKKLALVSTDNKTSDIWVCDLRRKTYSKLTFGGENRTPHWSPDGKKIAYSKLINDNESGIFLKASDGSSKEEEIYRQRNRLFIDDWSKDGKYIICESLTTNNQTDIIILPLNGDNKKPIDFLATKDDEYNARCSPDGKWIAYISNESGSYQLYIRPFINNNISGKWQVSSDGGEEPIWSPDGKTLYYRPHGSTLAAISVSDSPTITFGLPRVISNNFPDLYTSSWLSYDITSDGKYFLTTSSNRNDRNNGINVILNWEKEISPLLKSE